VFTAAVLASLAFAMQHLHLTGQSTDQFMLGFATVSQVAATGEWHIDLTLPRTGFGAPIWVVLVAVSGAAILTVALVLKEVGSRPDFEDPDAVRDRIEQIVRHQFHILFAPLGAIFIYQSLSVAGGTDKPMLVALAALGAGATMPALMTKAEKSALKVLQGQ
jgi:hypothetical protein